LFYGDHLRKVRMESGLTLKKLSEGSGVHIRTLLRLEASIGNPKIDTLADIAKYFGMTVDDLFLKKPVN
jgi:transcriptional regulator with XRE-family HTH domain